LEGVHSGYTEELRTSRFLRRNKTAVFQIGVNKFPPNFDTTFATSLEVIRR